MNLDAFGWATSIISGIIGCVLGCIAFYNYISKKGKTIKTKIIAFLAVVFIVISLICLYFIYDDNSKKAANYETTDTTNPSPTDDGGSTGGGSTSGGSTGGGSTGGGSIQLPKTEREILEEKYSGKYQKGDLDFEITSAENANCKITIRKFIGDPYGKQVFINIPNSYGKMLIDNYTGTINFFIDEGTYEIQVCDRGYVMEKFTIKTEAVKNTLDFTYDLKNPPLTY